MPDRQPPQQLAEPNPSIKSLALNIEGLRLSYDSNEVLRVDKLALQRGEELVVIGPSGCGKTSFLHIVAGLLQPSEGSVEVLGTRWTDSRQAGRDRFRGRHIGIVFQRLHLLPALSVIENLVVSQRLAGVPVNRDEIHAKLGSLCIAQLAKAKPAVLSVGQAQRVAIARALINKPGLIMADEPTSSLDDANAARSIDLLREHAAAVGASLLVVTHDQRVRSTFSREFIMGADAFGAEA